MYSVTEVQEKETADRAKYVNNKKRMAESHAAASWNGNYDHRVVMLK